MDTRNQTPVITVSLDNGATFQEAPQGVIIEYAGMPVVLDGDDENQAMVRINHSHEGIIMDCFGTRAEKYDTHLGTASMDLDDIVDFVTRTDTTDA